MRRRVVVPGEWLLSDEPVEINAGRRTLRIPVRNTGDRPIQVGSHFHFFEVNRALDFDRPATVGMRLDVPSGTSIRFEAGDEREVVLVEFGGLRRVIGFNGLLDGATSTQSRVERALRRAAEHGFSGVRNEQARRS
jgi:urease beta subunit